MALKNRSRVEILYDIIASAKTPARKTHLMYKSNLSFKQLDLYLEYILENGLLEERVDDEGSRMYCLTNRGNEFLGLFEHMQTFFPQIRPRETVTPADLQVVHPHPLSIVKPTFVY